MHSSTTVAWHGHEGPRLARAKHYDIIDCAACGFRHAVPLPDGAAIEAAYRDRYYVEDKPDFLARSEEDQAWAELGQCDRLGVLERVLGPGRRRLIDIGCGPGFFLKTAQARGWQVRGVEPSRAAAAHARGLGLDIVEAMFEANTAVNLGRFDAVHLCNVLEHVPDPAGILRCARAILDPGGAIAIVVPNDFTPFQAAGRAAAGADEWWVAPPHHLNYFDFASLERLLDKLGFATVERLTSFPMEMFLMLGENYIGDDGLGRACHGKRKRLDHLLEAAGARRAFYGALAEAGIGREAVVIASRP